MIRYRNGAYEVVVNVGHDPVSGKEKRVSRSVRMPQANGRIPREVLEVEAKLRIAVTQGAHGGPDMTVAEMLDRWIEHAKTNLTATTNHGYRRIIRLYLKPAFGDVKLTKLTTAHLDRLYDRLLARGLSTSTVRQAHSVIRRALRQAERWGWVQANVARLADPPSQTQRESTTPSLAEIERLASAAPPELELLIRLAVATGLRRGELAGLRWSDIDYDAGELRVQRAVAAFGRERVIKPPKSGKARVVLIGPNLVALLKSRRAESAARALRFGTGLVPDAYVLSDDWNGADPLDVTKVGDRFMRHARRLGLPTRLHDLRHATATIALGNGASPADVAAQLGHASTSITLDTYGHPTPAGLRHVADILDAI